MDIEELRERAKKAGIQVDNDTVSRRTAAVLLGRSEKTLANWASSGIGPQQIPGGRSRYTLAELELFMACHRDRRRRGEKKFSRLSRIQEKAS